MASTDWERLSDEWTSQRSVPTLNPPPGDEAKPLVSIIMPMSNEASFVGPSVRSVLRQTFEDWELLVVDDASTDGSVEEFRAVAAGDERVILLRNEEPEGAAAARNHAIRLARGRYIAFLDSDDAWMPEKLEKQLALFERTDAPLTYTNYVKIRRQQQVDPTNFSPTRRIVRAPQQLNYTSMLRQDYIGFLTAMYDTEKLGKRYFAPLTRRQDYAMLLEIFREGHEARGLDEPLAIYRVARTGSLSSNKIKSSRYNWHIYRHVEKLPLPRALVAFANYAVRSGLKYLI